MADDVAEQVLRVALERLHFVILCADNVRLVFNLCAEERKQPEQVDDADPLKTLEEDHDIAVRHFDGLVDLCERADLVKVRGGWILDPGIQLGNNAQQLFFARQGIDERQRAFPTYRQRQNRAGKQNCVPNRQDRKCLWHSIFTFGHKLSSGAWAETPCKTLDAGVVKRMRTLASTKGKNI
jgi:hypothetical protein